MPKKIKHFAKNFIQGIKNILKIVDLLILIIYNIINNGHYVTLEIESSKTKGPKNNKRTIVKKYKVNGRYGVHYYNLKAIKEKPIRVDEESEHKLMWFKHLEQRSFVVNRKDENLVYLQIVNPNVSNVTYWENGEEVSAAQLIKDGFLKESVEERPLILTINLNNIKKINYKKSK